MLSGIIIDDEPNAIKTLELMIKRYCGNVHITGTAGNIKSAVDEISSKNPDLIFLDIDLNPGSGFDILKQIPYKKYHIIFITAYNEYAIDAFRYCAVDYLLKPVNPDLLIEAVQKVVSNKEQNKNEFLKYEKLIQKFDNIHELKLAMPTHKGIIYININEIILFKGDRNYTQVHLNNGQKITSSRNLQEFENQLKGANFFRIHKSYLININYVKMLHKESGCYVEMINGYSVAVPKSRKESFMQFMKNLSV
ncbi:MAG: LytTR family DNA-binding domain-containing protein [Ignavibacteria bacterium]|jgi:two-component system LytT family response regulator